MMKKTLFFLLLFLVLFTLPVHAEEQEDDTSSAASWQQYYDDQMEKSGANDLKDELPNDTKKMMENAGIYEADWQSLANLNPGNLFGTIFGVAKEKSPAPFAAIAQILAVILLCALIDGLKLSFSEGPLGGLMGVVGTLCICVILVSPIVNCIASAASVIQGAATFMLCYVPVIAGIMIAGGQTVSAGSYHLMMMGAGEIISQIASRFLVPLLNVFLSISIVSSISAKLNLKGICDMFYKVVKWVLGLSMTIFVSLMTIQSLVGTAADGTGNKAAKFLISSFVPVVGGALGEAFSTVQGCVKLLKSGVGAFGIIAAAFIFLPTIVECLLWQLTVQVSAAVSDIFELRQISDLLRAAGKVLSMMLSIILCCVTILIVSTVIVLMIGGGGGAA